MKNKKTMLGQFFTKEDLWLKPQVKRFIEKISPSNILDPFAGQGDLLRVINKKYPNISTYGLDIDKSLGWEVNDSLVCIKDGYDLILTNPPYLAKNSAKRKKLSICKYFNNKNSDFQDIYQIALIKCLEASKNIIAIVPETFISFIIFRSNFFIQYLESITVLEDKLFDDTSCPICVVCLKTYGKNANTVYKGEKYVNKLTNLLLSRKSVIDAGKTIKKEVIFNARDGNIAIICIDGQSANDKIRFLKPQDLKYNKDKIKISSRAITIVNVNLEKKETNEVIHIANSILFDYRDNCSDLLLTPFKGNNKNGIRRRRLDFNLAKAILKIAIQES